MTQGTQEVQSFSAGSWRRSIYRAGTIGLTPPLQQERIRLRRHGRAEVHKVMLYLPHELMAQVGDHYRRAGQAAPQTSLNVLAYDDALLARTAVGLVRAARAGAPELYAEAAAHWLAVHLLARHSPWQGTQEDDRAPGALARGRLATVIEYMREHLGEPLTLDELAREAGVSKFHFTRLFRSQTGTTPFAHLTQLRLQTARRLLLTTDAPIAQIAARCGFRSAAHFSTRFTREYGLTPSALRRSR